MRVVVAQSQAGRKAGGAATPLLRRRMIATDTERLCAHFVGGCWRAPCATQALMLADAAGRPLGQVVTAGRDDLLRARDSMAPADDAARLRLMRAVDAGLPALRAAWHRQNAPEPDLCALISGLASPAAPAPGVICQPLPLRELGHALGAGLRGGLIWCPPPSQALFAVALMQLAQGVDLPPGAMNLLHAATPQTRRLIRALGLAVLASGVDARAEDALGDVPARHPPPREFGV